MNMPVQIPVKVEGVRIVPAREDDFEILARNIRDMDRLEVESVLGLTVEEAFPQLHAESLRTRAGYHDGALVAVWGITAPTVISRTGTPWLLATKHLEASPAARREVLRGSRREFDKLVEGYEMLWNYVHAENRVAIRWLRWLGFTFPDVRLTIGGQPFLYFQMEER